MLSSPAAVQVAWMAAEAVCVAAVLSALLRLRRVLGLAAVYTTLGVLYQLSGFLAGTLYVQVGPGLTMSPGSVVLFPANLFVVLFVYLREDAYEARRLIYGLFAANVVIVLMGALVTNHLTSPVVINPHHLSPELFLQQPRIALVGVSVLFLDTILIVLIYEWLHRKLRQWNFLPIAVSMSTVLALDTVLFVTGCFFDHPAFASILVSGLVGKFCSGLFYATVLWAYLTFVSDAHAGPRAERPTLGGMLQLLTYRYKYEALRTQIAKDALTGLHNRGFFDEALPRELGVANGKPVTLLMVDVDHFKRINDGAGHLEGDRVLRGIAVALMAEARGSDLVCRYGGEEFALILPATDLEQGKTLARRIQAAIPRSCVWRKGGVDGGAVTVTIGCASSFEADGPEALIALADARLYAGKHAGRNRVVASDEPGAAGPPSSQTSAERPIG